MGARTRVHQGDTGPRGVSGQGRYRVLRVVASAGRAFRTCLP